MIVTYSIFCFLFTAGYLALVVYFINGWTNVKRPVIKTANLNTKVTVLIAARNEAERIHYTIEDILAQDYPKHLLEVIIVDDHSTDSTAQIIGSYAHRGITLLKLNEAQPLNSYKKKAITKAIEISTGDLMVATDADCRMGPRWLSTIVGYYEAYDPIMISSPVTFFEERSLFERLQTLEFSFLIGIGVAFIGQGRASTCNGANLAYRKDVFYEVGGFKGIDDVASGDDELLLQKVAERFPGKVGFLKLNDAIVYTHAKYNLKEFLQQRRRWASKSTKYKDKKIIALSLYMWAFNMLLILNLLLGVFNIVFLKILLLQMIFKFLFEVVFLYKVCSFLKRVALLVLLPIVEPLHIVYLGYLALMGTTRKYSWKGRMVK